MLGLHAHHPVSIMPTLAVMDREYGNTILSTIISQIDLGYATSATGSSTASLSTLNNNVSFQSIMRVIDFYDGTSYASNPRKLSNTVRTVEPAWAKEIKSGDTVYSLVPTTRDKVLSIYWANANLITSLDWSKVLTSNSGVRIKGMIDLRSLYNLKKFTVYGSQISGIMLPSNIEEVYLSNGADGNNSSYGYHTGLSATTTMSQWGGGSGVDVPPGIPTLDFSANPRIKKLWVSAGKTDTLILPATDELTELICHFNTISLFNRLPLSLVTLQTGSINSGSTNGRGQNGNSGTTPTTPIRVGTISSTDGLLDLSGMGALQNLYIGMSGWKDVKLPAGNTLKNFHFAQNLIGKISREGTTNNSLIGGADVWPNSLEVIKGGNNNATGVASNGQGSAAGIKYLNLSNVTNLQSVEMEACKVEYVNLPTTNTATNINLSNNRVMSIDRVPSTVTTFRLGNGASTGFNAGNTLAPAGTTTTSYGQAPVGSPSALDLSNLTAPVIVDVRASKLTSLTLPSTNAARQSITNWTTGHPRETTELLPTTVNNFASNTHDYSLFTGCQNLVLTKSGYTLRGATPNLTLPNTNANLQSLHLSGNTINGWSSIIPANGANIGGWSGLTSLFAGSLLGGSTLGAVDTSSSSTLKLLDVRSAGVTSINIATSNNIFAIDARNNAGLTTVNANSSALKYLTLSGCAIGGTGLTLPPAPAGLNNMLYFTLSETSTNGQAGATPLQINLGSYTSGMTWISFLASYCNLAYPLTLPPSLTVSDFIIEGNPLLDSSLGTAIVNLDTLSVTGTVFSVIGTKLNQQFTTLGTNIKPRETYLTGVGMSQANVGFNIKRMLVNRLNFITGVTRVLSIGGGAGAMANATPTGTFQYPTSTGGVAHTGGVPGDKLDGFTGNIFALSDADITSLANGTGRTGGSGSNTPWTGKEMLKVLKDLPLTNGTGLRHGTWTLAYN